MNFKRPRPRRSAGFAACTDSGSGARRRARRHGRRVRAWPRAPRSSRRTINGIAPEALAQIEALLREKETRSPAEQKIDSQLLYARRMQQGLPVAPGVQTLEVELPYAADGHVIVDVKAGQRHHQSAGAAQRRHRGADEDVARRSPAPRRPRSDRGDRGAARRAVRPAASGGVHVTHRRSTRDRPADSQAPCGAPRWARPSTALHRADPIHEPRRHRDRDRDHVAGGHHAPIGRLPRLDRVQRHRREDRRAVGRRRAPRGCAGVWRSRPRHRAPGAGRHRRRRHGDARAHSRHRARRAVVLRHRVHLDHLVRATTSATFAPPAATSSWTTSATSWSRRSRTARARRSSRRPTAAS